MKINVRELFISISEALIIYGLIIVGYGILIIHITKTWSGDWLVNRGLPSWFTLDNLMIVSFALSFLGFIIWRYLKSTEPITRQTR